MQAKKWFVTITKKFAVSRWKQKKKLFRFMQFLKDIFLFITTCTMYNCTFSMRLREVLLNERYSQTSTRMN